MFSFLARLRSILFFAFLFLSFVRASQDLDVLFTSSVTYCEPPESLLIQQFDITYVAQNQSVNFNISAASVEANVNVTANLMLNVYGMNPVNLTIDLCSILGGALCPLPMYNFIGSDSIALPASLDISSMLPAIAFKIPDLEAFAQLTLTEVGTNNIKACIQATLSNGWSTQQPAVKWSTRGLGLATFLFAAWQSLHPDSLVPFRFLDLVYLYQSIATTGLLSLNFPSLYRSFTLNFAWSLGLFSSTSIQNSINRMRHLTGGAMANATASSPIGLVNRKLSPFNMALAGNNFAAPQSFIALPSLPGDADLTPFRSFLAAPASLDNIKQFRKIVSTAGQVQTVTTLSKNILQAGMDIYTNSLHIATANAFMTVFLVALMFIAVVLALLASGYAVLFLIARLGKLNMGKIHANYPPFARSWAVRTLLIIFPPIILFSIFQWTLKDSWLSILLSVISFVAVLGGVGFVTFSIWRIVRQDGAGHLYTDEHLAMTHGAVYTQYRQPRYYFFLPLLVASFLKALFAAVVKNNGGAQIILFAVIEGFVIVANLLLKPAKTRGGDVLSTFLAVIRFVCAGLLIAFVEGFSVAAIPRTVIGAVTAVLFSVAIIVMFINLLWSLFRVFVPKKNNKTVDSESTIDVDTEKDMKLPSTAPSFSRPRNPTPTANVPLEASVYETYPTRTPTTATTLNHSVYTADSASTTYGNVLPRRWSLSQEAPWGQEHPRESDESLRRHSQTGL